MTDAELMARMRVDISPRRAGRMEIVKFSVSANDWKGKAWYGPRAPEEGEYTKLQEQQPDHPEGGIVWMSDTRAELKDHLEAARRIADPATKRVLINGLGLGCIVKLASSFDHIERIDVVEYDDRVYKMVGRYFNLEHGDPRVWIIPDDAYEIDWHPTQQPWDVVWHDIWPHISNDNLPGMRRLVEKYDGRCGWQGCWALAGCLWMHQQEEELWRMVEQVDGHMPTEGHELYETWLQWLANDVDARWFASSSVEA